MTPARPFLGPDGSGIIASAMPQRLPDLVGRAMIDPEFLADLQRAPEAVLAGFELDEAERRAVLGAVARLTTTPRAQRAEALRTALIRRVAT
ncbi:MAG TPA: hypothetical protein VNN07_06100 [Candidatus Tectomicrobia bacterium]|nr:hypothetical protein [Candidatus Tectomicrobia bacterium]